MEEGERAGQVESSSRHHGRVPQVVALIELWALRRRDVDPLHGVLHVERALKEINSSAESMAEDKGLVFGPTKRTRSAS